MGLLTDIVEEQHAKKRQEASTRLDAYRAIVSSPQATDDAKNYAIEQLLHTAGIKGKDQGPMAQMFGHFLGIGKGQQPGQGGPQQGQQQGGPVPAQPGAQTQAPDSLKGADYDPNTKQGTVPVSELPLPNKPQAQASAPQQAQQQSQQAGMTPMPQQQAGMSSMPQRPQKWFKTSAEMSGEQLDYEQKHQDILSKSKMQENAAKSDADLKAKIQLQKERNEKLTPPERKDLETARGLLQSEGGDPADESQVHQRLSQMIQERESDAKEKRAEDEKKTEASIRKLDSGVRKDEAEAIKSVAQALKAKGEGAGAAAGISSSPAHHKGLVRNAVAQAKAVQDPGVDLAAWEYLTTGKLPGLGLGKEAGAKKWQLVQRAGQIGEQMGLDPADVQSYRSNIASNRGALAKLTWTQAAMNQFEGTVERNMQTAEQLNEQFNRTKYPFANRIIAYSRTGSGDPVTVKFMTQLGTIATEYAKVMQGSTSATGVTVNSDKEARQVINGYLAKGQITELFSLLRTDMENRRSSVEQERGRLIGQIKGVPAAQPQPPTQSQQQAAPAQAQAGQPKDGDTQSHAGHSYRFDASKNQWIKQRQQVAAAQ